MSAVHVPSATNANAQLLDALAGLCERYDLVDIYAFGSRANEIAARVQGEPVVVEFPESDVDIGVLPGYGRQLALGDKVGLAVYLEDRFRVGRVDVVVLPEADPFLAANIVRGERLYVAHEYEADEFDLYALRRAGDLAPLERERIAIILGGTP